MPEEITRTGIETAISKGLTSYMTEQTAKRGLPELSWHLRDFDYAAKEIAGMASFTDHKDPVKAVGAYADAYGVEPQVLPHDRFPTLHADFEVDGVKVTVWCSIPAEERSDG